MTTEQILIAIISAFAGGGTLATLVGYLVNRKKRKAETRKLDAETRHLEADAAHKLADATSEIITKFRELLDESEERCSEKIAELEKDVCTIKENYAKLKQAYDDLKSDYALLLSWAKSVSDILRDRRIPYPDPPQKLETVIPRNGESQLGEYRL